MKKRRLFLVPILISTILITSCGTVGNQDELDIDAINSSLEEEIRLRDEELSSENDDSAQSDNMKMSIVRTCDSYEQFATDDVILNPDYANVRQVVCEKAEDYSLQGTVLVGVGDELVYVESFGKASQWQNIDNTNTTRYGIASLTKSFTAAAIMQLYEEGKLDINDTIDQYFPDYKYGNEITILELMQMRSGIVDYLNDMKHYMTVADSKAIYDKYMEAEDYKGLDEYPWTREDMLKNLYNNELLFEPDEQYYYCNTNYYLLGCIIEQVSGMTYDEYITENILTPCAMTSSNLAPLSNDAVGYIRKEGFVSSNYEILFSAGGIRSNAFDMYSWMRNLSKGKVVSNESFEMMIDSSEVARKNQLHYEKEQEKLREELGDEYEEPEIDEDVIPTYYCCGLMVTGSEVWHRGYIDGFSNYMSVNLDTDVTIIILTNTSDDKKIKDLAKLWKDISEATNASLGNH